MSEVPLYPQGNPATTLGLNVVGLRRAGACNDQVPVQRERERARERERVRARKRERSRERERERERERQSESARERGGAKHRVGACNDQVTSPSFSHGGVQHFHQK